MEPQQGRPDWAAAIAAAQSRLPALAVPESVTERTRRAMAIFGAKPPGDDGEPEDGTGPADSGQEEDS